MRVVLATAWLAAILVAGFFLGLLTVAALAQSHSHPPQDEELHFKFYRYWMRPDNPTLSCCSHHDCYPAETKFIDGQWYAKRREDGKWMRVPDSKIEMNKSSPDTRAHVCAYPPGYGNDSPICFIPGGGT